MMRSLLLLLSLAFQASSFGLQAPLLTSRTNRAPALFSESPATSESETSDAAAAVELPPKVDPKEAVKVFGRLAEKYIMLDASAGMCCYSACSDCEFRLPDGGYRMADQSAARPKWIPNYERRSANGKEHTTKWRSQLFAQGPALSEDAFCQALQALDYAPTLGGPFVAAKAGAEMADDTAARVFYQVLTNGKNVLTRNQMSVRIKQLSDGEEGMTWNSFERAMGLK
mmetsp:Transcript_7697/g.16062  ORF Transcript_7697/g.16062 Transcript_7697/m.16062 type:complete len:227 (-) Transcript_7697:259-939(-)